MIQDNQHSRFIGAQKGGGGCLRKEEHSPDIYSIQFPAHHETCSRSYVHMLHVPITSSHLFEIVYRFVSKNPWVGLR